MANDCYKYRVNTKKRRKKGKKNHGEQYIYNTVSANLLYNLEKKLGGGGLQHP